MVPARPSGPHLTPGLDLSESDLPVVIPRLFPLEAPLETAWSLLDCVLGSGALDGRMRADSVESAGFQ